MGGGALGEGDVVELLLFDVDEAEGVGGFFPEGGFAEGAVELEPWLEGWMLGHGWEDDSWCWDGGCRVGAGEEPRLLVCPSMAVLTYLCDFVLLYIGHGCNCGCGKNESVCGRCKDLCAVIPSIIQASLSIAFLPSTFRECPTV